MGNKNTSGQRQTLQHQNSVPATVSTNSRVNQRRCSEFRVKSAEAMVDRPSTNLSSGDSSSRLNR